jgi:predicted CXXCH cytochrome family protein
MQYFEASTMAEAFAEEDLVGCEECHGNHEVQRTNDEMVGVGDNSVCVDCHAEGDEGYAAAQEIYGQITGLSTIYMTALENQKDVQHKGMDDVEIEFLLQEAHQSLVQARTLVHTFESGRGAFAR